MPESQCVLGKAEVYGPLSQGVVLARLRHINERASVRRELATAAALAGEGGYGAVLDQRTGQIEYGWLGHRRGNCAEELRSLTATPKTLGAAGAGVVGVSWTASWRSVG